MPANRNDDLAFFLGGRDLEMRTIRQLLSDHVATERIFDRRLSWGAKASDYADELARVENEGLRPVLVELTVDVPLPHSAIVVDHHNQRAGAGQPTSLEQVFDLLGLRPRHWTRWFDLVAANDRGHLAELERCGATRAEMLQVRQADRQAQGVTPEEEKQAAVAVANVRLFCDGRLSVLHLTHERTSAAADMMESLLGGPGYENLLICTATTANFFGCGRLVDRLAQEFPGSWFGGALPQRGFWGAKVSCDGVIAKLQTWIT